MDRELAKRLSARAVTIGREGEVEAFPELLELLRSSSADEFGRSQQAFQRVFCDRCFDEVFLDRRNLEAQVEINKTIAAPDGTVVQSEGERRIAAWLTAHSRAGAFQRIDRNIQCPTNPISST